jgi:hypothetical protein
VSPSDKSRSLCLKPIKPFKAPKKRRVASLEDEADNAESDEMESDFGGEAMLALDNADIANSSEDDLVRPSTPKRRRT